MSFLEVVLVRRKTHPLRTKQKKKKCFSWNCGLRDWATFFSPLICSRIVQRSTSATTLFPTNFSFPFFFTSKTSLFWALKMNPRKNSTPGWSLCYIIWLVIINQLSLLYDVLKTGFQKEMQRNEWFNIHLPKYTSKSFHTSSSVRRISLWGGFLSGSGRRSLGTLRPHIVQPDLERSEKKIV